MNFEMPILNLQENEMIVQKGQVHSYPLHTHTYYEILLYEPFGGQITLNGKPFEVTAPTAILVAPHDIHSVSAAKTGRFIKLCFARNAIAAMIHPPESSYLLLSPKPDGFLVQCFQELCRAGENREYRLLLISTIVHLLQENGQAVIAEKGLKTHRTVNCAIRHLNHCFAQDITLTGTAEMLGISPPYLSFIFKKETGMNFNAYLSGMRLEYAARLLKSTEKSVSEICYECGYSNFSHFLRSFKAVFGTSPQKFRHEIDYIPFIW